jgi:hypothetical protein
VPVFEYVRGTYEIKWPTLSFGTLFEISTPPSPPWIVSFSMPRDYEREWWMAYVDYMNNDVRKQWRRALMPLGDELPPAAGV